MEPWQPFLCGQLKYLNSELNMIAKRFKQGSYEVTLPHLSVTAHDPHNGASNDEVALVVRTAPQTAGKADGAKKTLWAVVVVA